MTAVLLVDDTRENLVALAAILEPLQHELVSATSGEQALRHLLTRDFAVILLDVQMPGLDGFETAQLIKQRERTRDIPIIFLTAISKDEQHVFRGYSAGAVDYIFKPYDPAILRSKVSVFVDLHERTERLKRQEEELRERELEALREVEARRYRELADSMPQMVWRSAADGTVDYVNTRWIEFTGASPSQGEMQGIVHPDERDETIERWTRSRETGEPFEIEYRLRRASDGVYRWHLGRALPIRDAEGAIVSWVGTATDIDQAKRLEQSERFLVEAGAVLHGSLEYRETLAAVARLAVPHIADWCVVDVLEDDGRLRTLALEHVDPTKVQFAREMQERYPPQPDSETGPRAVVRSGTSELARELSDELLAAAAVDELHLELLRELGLRSYMCVPLLAHGRTLGAITFIAAESGRVYGKQDLALAEELARRAATAIENAQLYAEAEARAQAARVLASVGDGVFMVEREANAIRLWNPAAEAITGLREADLLGRSPDEAIPGWSDVRGLVPLLGAPGRAGARAETVPLELGGRELWLSISGVELDDGVVYAFRDLTEERALEKMKSDFVATVSHELRTPLAAIYGSAVTVRREDLELEDVTRDRLLQVIAEESSRLAEIVNDLLLASHLDSGRLKVAIESCDPREIASGVLEAAETHLPDNLTLQLDAPEPLPQVAADPGQLRQVLVNLVENAVKYSPDGGLVRVELTRQNGSIRFGVLDNGLGIPSGEQQRIFEKFYRVDPNMTRGIGGTGLGLYICRELVRRVGGRIWVESPTGGGSAFFVEIPVADGELLPEPREGKTRRRTARAGAKAAR
jgi:PAS domain S-box-containing protein